MIRNHLPQDVEKFGLTFGDNEGGEQKPLAMSSPPVSPAPQSRQCEGEGIGHILSKLSRKIHTDPVRRNLTLGQLEFDIPHTAIRIQARCVEDPVARNHPQALILRVIKYYCLSLIPLMIRSV